MRESIKINLIQCDVVTGNLKANADKIIKAVLSAKDVALCIAPQEALCGPGAQCFADQPDYNAACRDVIQYLCNQLGIGHVLLCGLPDGKHVLINDGYYASVANDFFINTIKFFPGIDYEQSGEADILINLPTQPFTGGSGAAREDTLRRIAMENYVWVLSPNLVGGYGSHIYSGQSFAINPEGTVIARAAAFREDSIIIDIEYPKKNLTPLPSDIEAEWEALVLGVRDFVHKAGCSSVALGLSGGMDSALVVCIAVEALGAENVLAIAMPSQYSSEGSVKDASELAKNLGIPMEIVPIQPIFETFNAALEPLFKNILAGANDLTFENLQARIRGVLLMAVSNRKGALVLNTGNKSEASMGYCTLYGDTVGALAVLGDVYKTRVYELARWYCDIKQKQIIPRNIFDKAPSAELRPNQKDTDSLPPYEELDASLREILADKKVEYLPTELKTIRQKVFSFQYKRAQAPLPLIVSGSPLSACCSPINSAYNVDI